MPGSGQEVDESVSCRPDLAYRLQSEGWILADMGWETGAHLELGRQLPGGQRSVRIVGDGVAVGKAKLHVRAWLDVNMSMLGPGLGGAAPPPELLPPEGFPPAGFAPPDGFPPAGFPPPGGFPPSGFPPAGFPPSFGGDFPPGLPPTFPGGFPPGMPPAAFPPAMAPQTAAADGRSAFHAMPQHSSPRPAGAEAPWASSPTFLSPQPVGMSQEAFDEI